jgi:hypothetical protein
MGWIAEWLHLWLEDETGVLAATGLDVACTSAARITKPTAVPCVPLDSGLGFSSLTRIPLRS